MTVIRTVGGSEFSLDDNGIVAIAGDWHGDTFFSVRVVRALCEMGVKVIFHSGDFGYWSHDSIFVAQLNKFLRKNDMILLFVDGNHEHHERLGEVPIVESTGLRHVRKNILHIPRGVYVDLVGGDGVSHRWLGLGGAVSVDQEWRTNGVDWFPGEVISDDEHSLTRGVPNVEVMITHDSPMTRTLSDRYSRGGSGFPAWTLSLSNTHQKKLGVTVGKVSPSFLYHGHHHYRYDELWNGVQVLGLDCNGSNPGANIVLSNLDGCPNVELTRSFSALVNGQ